MNRRLVLVAALVIATLAPAFLPAARAQQDDPGSPRRTAPLTLLQLNDVYSIAPVATGMGGLARVATVKQKLMKAGRTPFMVLAGDFLSSSVESTVFKGEQMIATLNAAGLDLATLGNHEFDFGVDLLIQRMAEAKWQWVVSNVLDTKTGTPIGGASPYVIRTFGTLKVGFIGLCLVSEGIRSETLKQIRIVPPGDAAAMYLPALKREGVDVIVAVTHLTFAEDRELAERFPEIDLIIGGHEHFPITATENRTLISKSGSDAKYVARIDVNRRPNGTVERYYELLPITKEIADEPRTAAVVASYELRLSRELGTVVGRTRVPLDAVTVRLRASETNVGNLIADSMRADVASDIAIVNSGGIRGDRVHEPGPLTRRQLLEMQPFGNVNCKLEVSGQTVLAALESGVSKLPAAAGQFPQVSGLTLNVDPRAPAGHRVSGVKVNGAPLDLTSTYTLAISDFLLEGGDGYSMFAGARVLVGPEAGTLIAIALENYVTARGEVNPAVEARITIAR